MKQMSQFTLFQLKVAQSVTVNDIVRIEKSYNTCVS